MYDFVYFFFLIRPKLKPAYMFKLPNILLVENLGLL